MDNYRLQLEQMLSFFVEEAKKYNIELKSLPEGSLQHVQSGDRSQFLWKHDGKRHGINRRPDIICQLARKEFIIKTLSEINSNISVLERALSEFRDVNPKDIIAAMTKAYQRLQPEMFFSSADNINSVFSSESEDLSARLASHEAWAAQPYERNTLPPGPYAQITSRGLTVRSNRELYIAERLYYYNVPFRYDQVIHINGYTLSPDFTFEQATKAELYLEYCGMMNDHEYMAHFFNKRKKYERCGDRKSVV